MSSTGKSPTYCCAVVVVDRFWNLYTQVPAAAPPPPPRYAQWTSAKPNTTSEVQQKR